MKIFAFTDIHGNLKIITKVIDQITKEKPDILICAGDLSNFGDKFKDLLFKFQKLKTLLLIIPGNHESPSLVKETCKKTNFAISIHKGAYILENYVFIGYGEGGFSREDRDFETIAKKFKKILEKNSKVILVTHAPPYKTKLDYLETTRSYHGNVSIRKYIEETQPIIAISGHLHENENKIDKINKTIVLNPGQGKIIEI